MLVLLFPPLYCGTLHKITGTVHSAPEHKVLSFPSSLQPQIKPFLLPIETLTPPPPPPPHTFFYQIAIE
jgi:hypothetical protein